MAERERRRGGGGEAQLRTRWPADRDRDRSRPARAALIGVAIGIGLSLALGCGEGPTPPPASPCPAASGPALRDAVARDRRALAAADIDGDGRDELVLVDQESARIMIIGVADDTSTATLHASLPTGTRPVDVVVADVDGDGSLDIITADAGADMTTVSFGEGALDSWSQAEFPAAVGVHRLAVVDVDADGRREIVRGSAVTGLVDALAITRDRQGLAWAGACVAPGYLSVAAAERWPLVITSSGDGSLVALEAGEGPTTILAAPVAESASASAELALGGFAGEAADEDALVIDLAGGGVLVRELGGASIVEPLDGLAGARALVSVASVADGPAAVVILSEPNGLLGLADGGLIQQGQLPPIALGSAPKLVSATLAAGATPELVVVGASALARSMQLRAPLRLGPPETTGLIEALALVDGVDAILGVNASAEVGVLGRDGGFHRLPGALATPEDGLVALVGELDGAGGRDLLIYSPTRGEWSTLRGLGEGSYEAMMNTALAGAPSAAALADLSGDGLDDLIVVSADDQTRRVHLADGEGGWLSDPLAISGQGGAPFVGHFSGDGRLDVAFVKLAPPIAEVFLGGGGEPLEVTGPLTTPLSTSITLAAAVIPADQDGPAELVVCQRGAAAFDERPRLTRIRLAEGGGGLVVDAALLPSAAPPPGLAALPDEIECGPVSVARDLGADEVLTTVMSEGTHQGEDTPTMALTFAWSRALGVGRYVRAQPLEIPPDSTLLAPLAPHAGGLGLVRATPGAGVQRHFIADDVVFVEAGSAELGWLAR